MPHLKNSSFNALFMRKNEKISKRSILKMFSLPESGPYSEYGYVFNKSNENGSVRIRIRKTPCLGVCKDNLREVQDMSSLTLELASLQYIVGSLLDCCVHKGN